MIIRNTIIITTEDSEISSGMNPLDVSEFSGNIVFSRDRLPASLKAEIDAFFSQAVKQLDEALLKPRHAEVLFP